MKGAKQDEGKTATNPGSDRNRAEAAGAAKTSPILGFFRIALLVYIGFVLLASVFVAPLIEYAGKNPVVDLDFVYLVLAAMIGLGLATAVFALSRSRMGERMKTEKCFRIVVAISAAALLTIQAFIIQGGFFTTGWDVRGLTSFDDLSTEYFSMYPNQILMEGLFQRIVQLGAMIGVDNEYLCLVVVGCVSTIVSMVAISFIAKRIAGYTAGYCTMILDAIFVGLSPWIFVPYSDTYGMLFTCLVLLFYVCIENRFVKAAGITFFSIVGYMIKPTIVFALLAIIIVEVLRFVASDKRKQLLTAMKAKAALGAGIATSAIVACMLAIGLTNQIKDIGLEIDEDAAFSATHFLMMGFNTESMGVWIEDDVLFSQSYPDPESRSKANLSAWLERVRDAGPIGIAKLMLQKSLSNYADGTFAWEREGNFYFFTNGTSDLVQSIYGIDSADPPFERENLFAPSAQILWLLVLLGAFACLCRRKPSKQIEVMTLALLMLSVFLMLFEARARYLYLYAPYFVLLATIGWQAIGGRVLDSIKTKTPTGALTQR